MALVHRPRVLILDEPTNGMDPAGMVEIRALLRSLAEQGVTVFMSTHIVSEVEQMADEVGIIHEGRMLDRLSRARLVTLGQARLVVSLPAPELGRQRRAELLKTRRSRVPLITALVVVVFPATAALFVFIVADPQRAKDLGILGQKAQITGITPDWPGLLLFSTQAAAVALLLLFSFIVTWLFGREFVDRTAQGLMALPVSRAAVVAAKFLVFAAGVAPNQSATPLSWLIVVATGLLGLWATQRWWRGPDAGL